MKVLSNCVPYNNTIQFSPVVRFYSNFLFLIFTVAPMFFFSVIGAIQMRDDNDDDDHA